VDFYRGVFEQAGAEVVWLPLDAALRAARSAGQCDRLEHFQARLLGSFDRARVWPRRYAEQTGFCRDAGRGTALIERVDGIFFNGGDQWLTLQAFRDPGQRATPELERILKRLEQGRLVLGGTSAGTAVQTAACMVTSGDPVAALDHGGQATPPAPPGCRRDESCPEGRDDATLTWHPAGGLGSFAPGVRDTHFSQRMRQFRLLQLLAETGQRYGFGIDETTALEAQRRGGRWRLRTHGRGAAWILEIAPGNVESAHPLAVGAARMVRLGPAQELLFDPARGLGRPSAPAAEAVPRCRRGDGDADFDALFRQSGLEAGCIELDTAHGAAQFGFGPAPAPGAPRVISLRLTELP